MARSDVFHSVVVTMCCALGLATVWMEIARADEPAVPVVTTIETAHDSLNAALWSQTSAEHAQVYRQIYRAAEAQLDASLRDRRWDAMPRGERSNDARKLPPAIIVDIDETVLDNGPYIARQIRDGQDSNEALWAAWVAQPLSGKPGAKALPGALDFVRRAHARKITVFYLSNRDASTADATLKALNEAGFEVKAKQFLGMGTDVPGCTPIKPSDKRCRRQLVARDYRVLMLFGDQLTDFMSISGTPSERLHSASEYDAWFGQRWWMLPNPMYGSWESATWQDLKDPSPAATRQAKQAALDAGE